MKKFTVFLCTILLVIGFMGTADALQLRLSSGLDSVTIADGGAGDLSGIAGVVVFSGPVGVFTVNVTTGVSKPLIGDTDSPRMDLNSIDVSSGFGTLTVELTDNDFLIDTPGPLGFNTLVGGTTDGTVLLDSYLDATNTEFGMGTLLADLGPFTPGAFSGSASGLSDPLPGTDPFALTLVATVTHSSAGQLTSFDAEIISEPGTMLLLGTGLIALVGFSRRRLFRK